MTSTQILCAAAAATLVLYVLPGGRTLARPLVLLSTLVHELGHGITAMLVGGSFKRLQVYADASGLALYEGRFSPLARATIAAGGPLAPPILAAGLFGAATRGEFAPHALLAFGALLALTALVFVRNVFGFAFALALGVALAAIALKARELAPLACAFLAIELALAAFARGDYLFKAHARTREGLVESDTAQIARALGLAHWFWGALIALLSLGVLAGGLWLFAYSSSVESR